MYVHSNTAANVGLALKTGKDIRRTGHTVLSFSPSDNPLTIMLKQRGQKPKASKRSTPKVKRNSKRARN